MMNHFAIFVLWLCQCNPTVTNTQITNSSSPLFLTLVRTMLREWGNSLGDNGRLNKVDGSQKNTRKKHVLRTVRKSWSLRRDTKEIVLQKEFKTWWSVPFLCIIEFIEFFFYLLVSCTMISFGRFNCVLHCSSVCFICEFLFQAANWTAR